METGIESASTAVATPVVLWAVVARSDDAEAVSPLLMRRLTARYGELWRDAIGRFAGNELHATDAQRTAAFRTADAAMRAALFLQHTLRHEAWPGRPLRAKIGIHADHDDARRPQPGHAALAAAGALAEAAAPGQIVVTRPAFDEADRACLQHPPSSEGDTPSLAWVDYGRYQIAGCGESAMGILGIGAAGVVSDRPPSDTERLRAQVKPHVSRMNVQSRLGGADEPMTLDVTAQPGMDEPTALPHDCAAAAARRPAIPVPSSGSGDEDTQPFERAADPLLNRILGDYRIAERIGSGGMGKVYRAQHRFLECDAAVKVLHDRYLRNPGFLTRFHHEAKVMRTLDHPHVVRVITLSETDGLYYLVMDFVTGPHGRSESLHDYLKARPAGRLPEDEVRTKAMQIADALAYIHRNQVVHLDLKPGNILIDRDGRLKLTDFGLAKVVGTEVTGIRGTEGYMPSEQQGKGNTIDQRADVYAFGVVLYRMLTGTKVVGLKPSEAVPGLAASWDKVVERCTKADPADRYPTMEEVIRDIAPPVAPPPLPVATEPRPQSNKLLLVALTLLALTTAIGGLAWSGVLPIPQDRLPPWLQGATLAPAAPLLTLETPEGREVFRGTPDPGPDGDEINFKLSAAAERYVHLLTIDGVNEVTLLTPPEEGLRLLPNEPRMARDQGIFWLGPWGALRVIVIASPSPFTAPLLVDPETSVLVKGLKTEVQVRGRDETFRVSLGDLLLDPSKYGVEKVERTIHILPPEGNP